MFFDSLILHVTIYMTNDVACTEVGSTSVDSSSFSISSSSSSGQHKSVNKVQNLFLPLPLWHSVVQYIPATLHEHLAAMEQSVTQLHPVRLLNYWHACCNDSLLLKSSIMSSSSNGDFFPPLDFRARNSFTRLACLTFAYFMPSLTLFLHGESLVVFGSLDLDDFFSGVC
jgi:hypothetical protein